MAYKLKVLLMNSVALSVFEEEGFTGVKKAYNETGELCGCDCEYIEKTFRTKAAKEAFIDGMATIAEHFELCEYAILDNHCRWE